MFVTKLSLYFHAEVSNSFLGAKCVRQLEVSTSSASRRETASDGLVRTAGGLVKTASAFFAVASVFVVPTSRTTTGAQDSSAIRPFTIPPVPQTVLDDLRRRVAGTRWPEKETVNDRFTKTAVSSARLYWESKLAFSAPEWDMCLASIMRPAAQTRIRMLMERGFHQPGDVENRLGYHVGRLGTESPKK
jgi:hypothetical protein